MASRIFVIATALLALGAVVARAAEQPPAGATVDYKSLQQVMEGFGSSTAWGSMPGDANMDAFYSLTKGAGLSIVRNRVPFRENPKVDDKFIAKDANGAYIFATANDDQGSYKNFKLQWDNWDLDKTRQLIAAIKANSDYQVAKVFSTPWTPPNNAIDKWKKPNEPESKQKHKLTDASYATKPETGGYLDPAHYQDYADLLADYVLGFKANMGVDLYGLSLQNEPNYDVDYESCDWTSQQLHDFLLVLDKEFTRKGVWKACPDLKIIAPEDNNFHDKLLAAVYADPATNKVVSIAAGHQYEYGPWSMANNVANLFSAKDRYQPNPFAASSSYGKQVWMTEWSMSAFGSAPAINQALALARVIHMDITRSHLSAFVFWWNRDLLVNNKPSKNLWAIAQYSRFVRPGWHVISATPAPAESVYLTAFANPRENRVAMVLLNVSSSPKTVPVTFAGIGKLADMTLYRTSATEDMAEIGKVPADGTGINADLPAASISTYYGQVVP